MDARDHWRPKRIVSGGQTGVDRAALDEALENGIPFGGWVPKGRAAEDGIIPATYSGLNETESDDPRVRTEWNVRDADATLLLTRGRPTGGSAYTLEAALRLNKPVLHVDLEEVSDNQASRQIQAWLDRIQPARLNVAGPRASEDPDIYGLSRDLFGKILSNRFGE